MTRTNASQAASMHKKAWERIAEAASHDRQAKYGLYASRTLAVKHPEIYLRADAWFAEGARRIKGFRECYEEPTALGWRHMEYGGMFFRQPAGYPGVSDGHELRLRDLVLKEYRPCPDRRVYPDPFLPFVDCRVAPLAVTLKTEGKVVTPLELAVLAYFQRREMGKDPARLFIAACGEGSAYLVDEDGIWDVVTLDRTKSVRASPYLVWNEGSAFHPLMERDDRPRDAHLAHAVKQLGGPPQVPHPASADPWHTEIRKLLQAASALEGEEQTLMAGLAAVRAGGWAFHPYGDMWQHFVPEADLDIDISRRLGIIREFDLWANRVSPVTAYFYGVFGTGGTRDDGLRALSRAYLVRTGVVRDAEARGWKAAWRLESWGHLWPCGLMEHTIDDAFRSRTGHCVSQSHMVSAILEAAGVDHLVVNFDRGGVKEGVNHHFVLARDGTFLVDDGIVNILGVDSATEDYGPLLSFSSGGDWAATSGDKLYGNISSARCAEHIEDIEHALNGRFTLTFYANEEEKVIESKTSFIGRLEQQEIEQVTLP